MILNGTHKTSIQIHEASELTTIEIIDQRLLPHHLEWETLSSVEEVGIAIKDMHLRGAPLIGGVAGFGAYFAVCEANPDQFEEDFTDACAYLRSTRPTAVNLMWAIDEIKDAVSHGDTIEKKKQYALNRAKSIVSDDIEQCRMIGVHGLALIEEIHEKNPGKPVNILTHCNAGWLACIDYGTATSPIYQAHDKGIPVHVWVDETRPRNQGARLTAYELGQHGIEHTIIADNTGGHLMQHRMVDLVITGTDRTTLNGDVANKIGTYLKALAAKDNDVPFYVALPSSTFDWELEDGMQIEIETRSEDEVLRMDGVDKNGQIHDILIMPATSKAVNYGFDVTPARLVTGLITERGICDANKESILGLFPEKK